MQAHGRANQMTPVDADLFATLTMLCGRRGIDDGILHSCTLDSMGHRFHHDCVEMDDACHALDATLAPFVARWRPAGYEVIVTVDHGQDARGHHGGTGELQHDFALYYFGPAEALGPDEVLGQRALAPTILGRLGVPVPATMTARPFLGG
jgi:hypothetical protein